MNRVRLWLSNPHTTLAAVAYVTAKLGCEIASVWVPSHSEQFRKTADLIEAAAVGWGLLNSTDARLSRSFQEQFAGSSDDKPQTPQPGAPVRERL